MTYERCGAAWTVDTKTIVEATETATAIVLRALVTMNNPDCGLFASLLWTPRFGVRQRTGSGNQMPGAIGSY